MPEVPWVDRDLGRDHDLLLVDCGLGVVALDVAARGLQKPRVGIGQVYLPLRNLGRCVWSWRSPESLSVACAPVDPVGLIGSVCARLHPQLLLQAALCLFQPCRARTRNWPGLLRAFLIELAFCLAQPPTTALTSRKVLGQLVAALLAVELILGGIDLCGLFEDLPRDLIEVDVRFAARVCMDLRAVDRDRPSLDHSRPRTQREHAAEQPGQRVGMLGAKPIDRHVIGREVRRDDPVGDILDALALDAPRVALALRIGVELSLIHISEPTRRTPISYAVFCLKKKKTNK